MIFDPERLRAYLQMVCSGLGFDIGEVWMTSTNGPSDHHGAAASPSTALVTNNSALKHAKHIRFIQLYTSRSYDGKRSKLVCPSKSVEDRFFKQKDGFLEVIDDDDPVEEAQDVQKHLISPRLVDVVTYSSQVVWANCQKREGLLGRSDMRLQTAVGMPITEDGLGHMCVLIMFSPDYIHSTDDAMEYLQFIRKTAMSSSIPSLMPAISSSDFHEAAGSNNHKYLSLSGQSQPASFGDGVVARFVSFKNSSDEAELEAHVNTRPEIHIVHDVRDAPKDCFGIPMLPDYAEFGFENENKSRTQSPFSEESASEAFDEASYGIWSTIMQLGSSFNNKSDNNGVATRVTPPTPPSSVDSSVVEDETIVTPAWNSDLDLIPNSKRERLEDFAVGFLGASAFDVADVWVPVNYGQLQVLRCVATASSFAVGGDKVETFKMTSLKTSLSVWSGAVGRAYGSGNPVWSSNYNVICDSSRADIFDALQIKTALAIPASSHSSSSPAFVICFYSMVRADSSPVVLKFLQQAIRLVWEGLEKIVSASNCSEAVVWNDIHPSDLGEMAADREMQDSFFSRKKRVLSYTDLTSQIAPQSDERFDYDSLSSRRMRTFEGSPMNDSVHSSTKKQISTSPSISTVDVSSIGYASAFEEQAKPLPEEAGCYISKEVKAEVASPMIGVSNTPQFQYFLSQPIEMKTNIPTVRTQSEYPYFNQAPIDVQTKQVQDVFSDRFEQLSFNQQFSLGLDRDVYQDIPPMYQHATDQTLVQPIPPSADTQSQFDQHLLHHKDYSSISCSSGTSSLNSSIHNLALFNGNPVVLGNNQLSGAVFVDEDVMRSGSQGVLKPSLPLQNQLGKSDSYDSITAINSLCQPVAGYVPVTEAFENSDRICRIQGCSNFAIVRRPYCFQHNGSRLCEYSGCTKCAQGSTKFCIAHGGGRRCTFPGCDKGARDKFYCAAHGGGKRCTFEGCKRSAVGGSSHCTAHGGGRRCSVEGCTKSAQSSTNYCVKHGGGKKCEHFGCQKVARGRTLYCAAHGGGIRCRLESCSRVAVGKQQLCRVHGGRSSKKSSEDSGDLSPTSTYNFDQF